MIKEIVRSSKFKRQYKKLMKKHYDQTLFEDALHALVFQETAKLNTKFKDHQLVDRAGIRELHISGDWLLLYQIDGEKLILYLLETGSHDELL
ncbi:type II toxin-antitoxin system YafQ family toxin [Lapidilactobacillus mulanensis]|uniref:Type II toxin-antitoxin system YafQ family toxin n=1 Tax=Lapidilactobacillus mulanensis TaxID=2485999 RepID=A0ABW4DP95_9LACO|nr:type II toxin-antitoxin system YafQ family toxin [Lapidilactobacillus mulanensis]